MTQSRPQEKQVAVSHGGSVDDELKRIEIALKQHALSLAKKPYRNPALWAPALTALLGLVIGAILTSSQYKTELANARTGAEVAKTQVQLSRQESAQIQKSLAEAQSQVASKQDEIRLLESEAGRLAIEIDESRQSAEAAIEFEQALLRKLVNLALEDIKNIALYKSTLESVVQPLRTMPFNNLSRVQQELVLLDLYVHNEDEKLIRLADSATESMNAELGYRLAGTLQLSRGSPQKAEATFRKGLLRRTDSDKMLKSLAATLLAQGRKEEARSAAEMAVAIERTAENVRALGWVAFQMGDRDQAIALASEAIQLDESLALAYVDLSHYYEPDGRIDERIALLERALQFEPFHPFINNNLAWAHYQNGDMLRAEQYAKVTLAHSPRLWNALHTLGLVALQQRQYDEAVSYLEKASLLAGGNDGVADDLSRAREMRSHNGVASP